LKLLSKEGLFLDPEAGKKIVKTVKDKSYKFAPYDRTGEMKLHEGATDYHIQAVLDLPYIDVKAIRERKFIVALDCVNGAGGVILPDLLEALGCIVFPIHCEPTGRFAHTPEPVPENLRDLCDYVRSNRADIGFATDPDGDRLAIVDDHGQPLGEEMTVTLAAQFILNKHPGRVVVNMSTTRAVEEVAESFGAECIRTPVGEIHVAKKMIESGAVIGGEGNGGVILPELHPGRDAPVAVALTLQHLLESGLSISDLAGKHPQYTIVKEKVTIGQADPDQIIEACMKLYRGKKANTLDGLKIDFTDSWVHIRKSNTEPIIRVIAEGRTKKAAQALCSQFVDEIRASE
jgi:phosphomannomutase